MAARRSWRSRLERLLSYCVCTRKTTAFNEFFFSAGQKHSRLLKVWFSVGAIFGVLAMVASTLVLAFQAFASLKHSDPEPSSIVSIVVPGMNAPWSDLVYIGIASVFNVAFHEAGHALAAASEGVPTEHIAVFSVLIFCGALVALSEDAIVLLTPSRRLRVHCAGIWHNAVCCLGCWIVLWLLPTLLVPLYTYRNGAVVLAVSEGSPLAGHLRPGDVIKAVDGSPVFETRDWLAKLQHSGEPQQGFCVPLTSSRCTGNATLYFTTMEVPESVYCLNATEILHSQRCSTSCSKAEQCMQPNLAKWEVLLRIYFAPSSNSSCKSTPPGEFSASLCAHNAVLFVGAPAALASLEVTDFLPRFAALLWLPGVLESLLVYTFRVGVALIVFNSAPMFYLDGEEILRCVLRFHTHSPSKRRKMLRFWLSFGTLVFLTVILVRSL